MRYKKITIMEDNELLNNSLTNSQIAKEVGCSRSYISYLRNNKMVATERFYIRLKQAVNKLLTGVSD